MREQNCESMSLTEKEIEEQISCILEKGLPSRKKRIEKIKERFIGPGFSVIFYNSKLIFAGSLLMYFCLIYLCDFIGTYVKHEEYFTILLYPLFHLVFHMLSYWAEEQESVIWLKESMHYSFQYMVSLRMFYVSMFSAALNVVLLNSVGSFEYMGKVNMVGLSSLFLFSVLTVMLCEKTKGSRAVLFTVGLWCLGCLILTVYGEKLSFLLFEVMPFTAHMMMLVFCFGLFIYYFGKVGKRYAYTCEY